MPKQKRYDIKQRITTMLHEIEVTQRKLASVHKEYADAAVMQRALRENYPNLYDELTTTQHEDLAAELLAYFQGLQIVYDGLAAFSDKI